MRARILFVIVAAFLFLNAGLTVQASAKELSVQKLLKTNDIRVGDDITIILRFSNPFGKPVNVQIKDKNVVSGNGMDIQCLEYTVPADKQSAIQYAPIKAFSAGTFTVDAASVTYTNPETGKQEEVKSNTLDITVKPSSSQQNLKQQGITTIYQCNGVNMRSTSYSTSSSTSIQINQNFNAPSQQNNQQPQQNPNIQQQDQDMGAVKRQMEEQVRKRKEMEKSIEKKLENDSQFKTLDRELKNKGYTPLSKNINPESNNTGSFEYTYKNKQGEQETIRGSIENGTVKNIEKWGDEEKKRLMQSIENSTQFRKLQNSLKKMGYNLSSKDIKHPSGNLSTFQYTYKNNASEMRITGNVTLSGQVTSIKLEGEKKSNPYGLMLLAALVLAVIAYMVYRKYFRKRPLPAKTKPVPVPQKKPRDFRKEALRGIEEAERLFSQGKKREAYTRLSRAVREYFIHTLSEGREEMTSTEILRILKNKSMPVHKHAKQCFDICDLVKFAKYRPNSRDFRKAAESGRMAVKGNIKN